MAKDITLLGASYPDVPAVVLPKTGGGTAEFYDLEEVFPVGGFWATQYKNLTPVMALGFGTWTLVSPVRATWDRLKATATWDEMLIDSGLVYVYQRTA